MRTYFALPIVVCLIGCIGCSQNKGTSNPQEDASEQRVALDASKIFVTLIDVALTDPSDSVRLVGASSSPNIIELSTDMAGMIESITVDEGKKVRKGQAIAQLDNALILAEINTLETQLNLAEIAFEKQERLYNQDVSTEIQYLEAKNNKEVLEASIASLKTRLGKNKVTTPISGVVDKVYATVGNVASPGFPIARIVNFSEMEVAMDIPETYISQVKQGDTMAVYFPTIDLERIAMVEYMSQVINPTNRTVNVLLKVDNQDNVIKHNMLAEIRMNQYSKGPNLFVPEQLVQQENQEYFIYLANPLEGDSSGGYSVTKQAVLPGVSLGGLREIREGLSVGDLVISENYRGVDEGDIVYLSPRQ